jgi:ribonucleoside-diphosphate reductase alpha chain
VGLYKDGTPGELFIRMAKEGSTVSVLMDSFATAVSLALQHGVPMKLMCEKFSHTRFEPSGFTGNPEIPIAKSIMDYIFRWLELRFVTGRQYPLFKDMMLAAPAASSELLAASQSSEALSSQQHSAISEAKPPQGGLANSQEPTAKSPSLVDRGLYHSADALKEFVDLGDAPSCHVCGAIMTRNGSCYRCMSCGSTSGCS